MKLFSLSIALISAFSFSSASNAELINKLCKEDFVSMHCASGNLDELKRIGNTDLNGITVKGATDVTGEFTATSSNLKTVNVRGNSHFIKTQISDAADLVGNFSADNSTFASEVKIVGNVSGTMSGFKARTNIVGNFNASNFSFREQASIVGDMQGDTLTFDKDLDITTVESTFSKSNFQSIYVGKSVVDSVIKAQKIILKGNSIINGDVVFAAKTGTLILTEGSVLKGRIIGGAVSKQ
jgi:hypothetical protein